MQEVRQKAGCKGSKYSDSDYANLSAPKRSGIYRGMADLAYRFSRPNKKPVTRLGKLHTTIVTNE